MHFVSKRTKKQTIKYTRETHLKSHTSPFFLLSLTMSLSCPFLLAHPSPPCRASLSFLWNLSVSFLSLSSFFSWCPGVTSTTCLSTTATLSATRWLSSSRGKRSHRTSQTFHLKFCPRESPQFNKHFNDLPFFSVFLFYLWQCSNRNVEFIIL